MSLNITSLVYGAPVVLPNGQSMPGIHHNEGVAEFQAEFQKSFQVTIMTPAQIAKKEAHATRQKKRYHDRKANERQKYKERKA